MEERTQAPDDAPRAPDWLDRAEYPFRSRWLDLPAGRMHYIDEGGRGGIGGGGSSEGESSAAVAGRAEDARAPESASSSVPSGRPEARRASDDVLLFVHGTPTWSFEWRHLVRGLSGRFRCVAPDHLGFGLSDRPRDFPYTPEAHAENLRAFVEQLGLTDVTLVVHDFGGPIGLPLALEGSGVRVRGLVLFNTWFWSLRGDKRMERPARLMSGRLGRWLYRRLNLSLRVIVPSAYGDRKRLTPEIHRQYLAPFPDAWSRGAVLWTLAHSLLGSSEHYERIWEAREELRRIPAQVVWGTKDSALPPYILDRVREGLPQARVAELPVGHWPHEEAPGEALEEVERFLADHPA